MGEVCVSPHQSIRAVPQQCGNGALCLSTHGEPTGKGMSERMPADTVQLECHHSRIEVSGIEVSLIQGRSERVRGIDPWTRHAKATVKNRDRAALQMTAVQIEKAQEMARRCQATKFKECD